MKTDLLQKYSEEVVAKFFNFQGKATDFVHIDMGLKTEAFELVSALKRKVGYGKDLDYINIKEELGDYLFFMVAYHLVNEWDLPKVTDIKLEKTTEPIIEIVSQYGFILNLMVNYRDVTSLGNEKGSLSWFYNFLYVANFYGFELDDLIKSNTAKLTFRHKGNEYNSKTVTKRNTEKERQKIK